MGKRLEGKVAVVVGAGQTPGDTIGNGRAISILFAREGAKVMLVDCHFESADETRSLIEAEGGTAFVFEADVTRARDCQKITEKCVEVYSRIDIMVYNVGVGQGGLGTFESSEQQWDRIFDINLKGMFNTIRHVIPVMENQGGGSIINISSVAAICSTSMHAYKASKAGVNAFTHSIAMQYADKGIRANVIMPGLINTPMAIEGQSRAQGIAKEDLIRLRDAAVPLKGGQGEGWDIGYAALFLASDEAKHITAVALPVDGGLAGRICTP
jgi:NAD(P)-dependent dehydrogenase (short-subunit alcohol dehydrogenase family)